PTRSGRAPLLSCPRIRYDRAPAAADPGRAPCALHPRVAARRPRGEGTRARGARLAAPRPARAATRRPRPGRGPPGGPRGPRAAWVRGGGRVGARPGARDARRAAARAGGVRPAAPRARRDRAVRAGARGPAGAPGLGEGSRAALVPSLRHAPDDRDPAPPSPRLGPRARDGRGPWGLGRAQLLPPLRGWSARAARRAGAAGRRAAPYPPA